MPVSPPPSTSLLLLTFRKGAGEEEGSVPGRLARCPRCQQRARGLRHQESGSREGSGEDFFDRFILFF